MDARRGRVWCEIIGPGPIRAPHDQIARYRADILDEPRKMEDDLRIARPVARLGRRDGLRLTELVDLHNPGNDGAACRLPDQTCRAPAGQREAAEKGQQIGRASSRERVCTYV